MIPRIKSVKPLKGYLLHVVFDDGKDCIYNVKEDIDTIKSYEDLENIVGSLMQAGHVYSGTITLICQVIRFMKMLYQMIKLPERKLALI